MDTAMKMAPKYIDIFSQKRVVLLPSEFQEGVYKAMCMMRPFLASFMRGWTGFPSYSYDPEAEPILMSHIVTQSLRHTKLGKSVLQQNRWQTEGGLFLHYLDLFDMSKAVFFDPNSERRIATDREAFIDVRVSSLI